MNGKKIATGLVCALAFGGIIANTCVFATNDNKLRDAIDNEKFERLQADDELNATIEEAQTNMANALNTAVTNLNATVHTLKEDLEASDIDIKNELIDQVNALTLKIEEARVKAENFALQEIEATADSLYEDLMAEIDDAYSYVDRYISSIIDQINVIFENYGLWIEELEDEDAAIRESIEALKEDLDDVKENYATVASVTKQITEVKLLIIENTSKIAYNATNISNNAQSILAIREAMEQFNGYNVTLVKEWWVNRIYTEYLNFKEELDNAYNEASSRYRWTRYASELTSIYNSLNDFHANDMQVWRQRGITRVTLAETPELAIEFGNAYTKVLRSFMNEWKFALAKIKTYEAIDSLTMDANSGWWFASTPNKDKFLDIVDAIEYDRSKTYSLLDLGSEENFPGQEGQEQIDYDNYYLSAAKAEKYFEEVTFELDYVEKAATAYEEIFDKYISLFFKTYSYSSLTWTQMLHYNENYGEIVDVDDFIEDVELDKILEVTNRELIVDVTNSIKDELDLMDYRADAYNKLIKEVYVADDEDEVTSPIEAVTSVLTKLDVEEVNTLATELEHYVGEDGKGGKFASILEFSDEVNNDGYVELTEDSSIYCKEQIDEIIASLKADIDREIKSATTWRNLEDYIEAHPLTTDDYRNLSTVERQAVENSINLLNEFDTYLDNTDPENPTYEDYMEEDPLHEGEYREDAVNVMYEKYQKEIELKIDEYLSIARDQSRIHGDFNELKAYIEENAKETDPYLDQTYFKAIAEAAYENYTLVDTDTNLIKTSATAELADENVTNFENDIVDIKKAVDILDAVEDAKIEYDALIDTYVNSFNESFIGDYNNKNSENNEKGDGYFVVTEFMKTYGDVDEKEAAGVTYTDVNGEENTVPSIDQLINTGYLDEEEEEVDPIKYQLESPSNDDLTTYTEMLANMKEKVNNNSEMSVDAVKETLNTAKTTLMGTTRVDMLAYYTAEETEFKEAKQVEILGENKDGTAGLINELYVNGCEAALNDPTVVAKLGVIKDKYVEAIEDANSSQQVLDIWDKCVAEFKEKGLPEIKKLFADDGKYYTYLKTELAALYGEEGVDSVVSEALETLKTSVAEATTIESIFKKGSPEIAEVGQPGDEGYKPLVPAVEDSGLLVTFNDAVLSVLTTKILGDTLDTSSGVLLEKANEFYARCADAEVNFNDFGLTALFDDDVVASIKAQTDAVSLFEEYERVLTAFDTMGNTVELYKLYATSLTNAEDKAALEETLKGHIETICDAKDEVSHSVPFATLEAECVKFIRTVLNDTKDSTGTVTHDGLVTQQYKKIAAICAGDVAQLDALHEALSKFDVVNNNANASSKQLYDAFWTFYNKAADLDYVEKKTELLGESFDGESEGNYYHDIKEGLEDLGIFTGDVLTAYNTALETSKVAKSNSALENAFGTFDEIAKDAILDYAVGESRDGISGKLGTSWLEDVYGKANEDPKFKEPDGFSDVFTSFIVDSILDCETALDVANAYHEADTVIDEFWIILNIRSFISEYQNNEVMNNLDGEIYDALSVIQTGIINETMSLSDVYGNIDTLTEDILNIMLFANGDGVNALKGTIALYKEWADGDQEKIALIDNAVSEFNSKVSLIEDIYDYIDAVGELGATLDEIDAMVS